MATPFHIRDAIPSPTNTDAHFITAAFDSCIPHLSTIGSASQWGTTPLTTARPDFITRHITAIAEAEQSRQHNYNPAEGPVARVLIAEAPLPGPEGGSIPVGAATLRAGYLPKYVLEQKHLKGVTGRLMGGEEGPFMFLEILVTDFREATKAYRKGAGAALVGYAKEWVRGLGMRVMFYEAQGFEKVDAFVVEKAGEEGWPGMFLRMDVGKKDSE
ncbi:predicted protein [Chaetomium globosum CBS 148.51]|uniref:N-acetyltransferase domain-containing protein n=1 Tax=Chaetomium globosum (strain ATCC 6205 / CBS 148.51 / DSM 1962 / NBRC 6347 / NRRL 1970) TaxID=306901 RepID=Q2HC25_CHAGB|nr:uncharacterized protein CHGG_02229 [Chaetomium globosum CBS 148.51]EAQ90294.1 predicted protein [Chaetomium globosum CBS 148.51]